jgi:hypothetical protein
MSKEEIRKIARQLAEQGLEPGDLPDQGTLPDLLRGEEPGLEEPLPPEEEEEPVRSGARDFRSVAMRRVDGALHEIQDIVTSLLDEVEEHRDAGNWDAEPSDLADYDYSVEELEMMVGRLRNPYY